MEDIPEHRIVSLRTRPHGIVAVGYQLLYYWFVGRLSSQVHEDLGVIGVAVVYQPCHTIPPALSTAIEAVSSLLKRPRISYMGPGGGGGGGGGLSHSQLHLF